MIERLVAYLGEWLGSFAGGARPAPAVSRSVPFRSLGRPRKLGLDVDGPAVLGGELAVVSLELGALAGVVRLPVGTGREPPNTDGTMLCMALDAAERSSRPWPSRMREMAICIEPVRRLQSRLFSLSLIS